MASSEKRGLLKIDGTQFAPVQRKAFVDGLDPSLCGYVVFELSPEGLRWWYEESEELAVQIPFSSIIGGAFIAEVEELEECVRIATDKLMLAKRRVIAMDRLRSFRRGHGRD